MSAVQTGSEIAVAVASGKQSAVEVAEAALARIEAGDGRINAFTAVFRDRALASAKAIDRRRAAASRSGRWRACLMRLRTCST